LNGSALSSLDPRTKLDHGPELKLLTRADAGWHCTIYPTVFEASVAFVGSDRGRRAKWETDERSRAARRVRSAMRRYAVSNGLVVMVVLTYAEATYDLGAAMRDVGVFKRRWARSDLELGPYMYAAEPHPKGHGAHVNFFVSRRYDYAERHQVGRLWGKGFIWLKDWRRDERVSDKRGPEQARAAARYGSKYASKDASELAKYGCAIGAGVHRYEVAQGYEAPAIQREFATFDGARSWVESAASGVLTESRSDEWDDYDGPRAAVWSWR
jgi:hypothetical protein